jgi:predicted small lipoprotein YifL
MPRILIACLTVVLVFVAGCGRKGDPVRPSDAVAPAAESGLPVEVPLDQPPLPAETD